MKPMLVTLEGNNINPDNLIYLEGNFSPSSYDDNFLYGDFYPDLAGFPQTNILNGNEELGFAWLRFLKMPKMRIPRANVPHFKPPTFSNPLKSIRLKTTIGKDLQRGISNIGKEGARGFQNIQKEIGKGTRDYFKNYQKAFSDVGKELQRGVSNIGREAGNLFSDSGQADQPEEDQTENQDFDSNVSTDDEDSGEMQEIESDDNLNYVESDSMDQIQESDNMADTMQGQFDNLFSTIGAGVGTSFAPGIGTSIGSDVGKLFSSVVDKKLGNNRPPVRKIKMAVNPKTKTVKLGTSRNFEPPPPNAPDDGKIFGIDKNKAMIGGAIGVVAIVLYMNKGKKKRR